MSAAYRPYRDEESVDGLEATAWTDNEPGSVQIYEKTTEELPFGANSKKQSLILAALILLGGLLGFLLGFFTVQKECITTLEENDAAELISSNFAHEDPTIKDKLIQNIAAQNILAFLKKYENQSRWPGSEADHAFSEYIQQEFSDYKMDSVTATNFTFKTMLPNKPSVVSILDRNNKTIFSNIQNEYYPYEDMRPFLPLSQAEATTLASNKLIYVNEGAKQDYIDLAKNFSISASDMRGKIFVIRQKYYQAHEVVINAQEVGAEALLLFPDPDTYGGTSPFPSSMQLPNDAGKSHPTAWSSYGDLASFNLSSTVGVDAAKLGLDKDAKVTIPVVLVSFDTASKLLRGLSGPTAPASWNCFDYTLYLGPGYRDENQDDMRASIKIEFHNQEVTLSTTTVTGSIAGSMEPDRYVVIGSRRDSLNRGLLDSVSGSAVMIEIARAFSELVYRHNWRPKRTIVFSSFGAESLNLIGSSHWLEDHQRLLHTRAVAYINCDQVITGNRTVSIAASPLLFQVLYNATKQISNPEYRQNNPFDPLLPSVYDVWKSVHHVSSSEVDSGKFVDQELERILEDNGVVESKLTKDEHGNELDGDDLLGASGSILSEYKKSATIKTRPRMRHLDLQSIYSPFLLYSGIPVVDVKYAGFRTKSSNYPNLLEDTFPFLGTKYDNLNTITMIDPQLKYHLAVAQTIAEIIRDLSDSAFLPFNLIEYAVVLRDSYANFEARHGTTFNRSDVDLEPLKEVIRDFTKTAIKFHHRQDQISLKDPLKVRKLNDQLMQLERNFLDSGSLSSHWERKHIILSPNNGQEHNVGFPALVDWLGMLEGDLESDDQEIFINILKVHYKLLIYTISNAIKLLDEVHVL